MSRDPRRLADIGANASPEDQLLATLIGKHREGRPDAAGFRALSKRLESRAAPAAQRGLFRFSLAGISAMLCAALVVNVARSLPSGGGDHSAESPPLAAQSPSVPPLPPPEPLRASEMPPESMAGISVHSLPSDSSVAPSSAVASPRRPAKVAQTRNPCDESELIDRAETLLRTGEPARALDVTRAHAACAETVLVQERERIAIQALVALGRRDEGRTRALAFETSFPSSPHLRRIRQLVGLGAE